MRRAGDVVRAWRSALAGVRSMSLEAGAQQSEYAVANGVPRVRASRKIMIYSPARTAGQQGTAQTTEGGGPTWKVQFDNQTKWINPLMGWTSTADAFENTGRALYFKSKEAAIAFAEKNGWAFEVQEPNRRSLLRPKRYQGYGDNYSVKRKGLPQGGLRSEQGKK